ncbi:UNVERIFIED_CONTAM: hypothetical protein RKD43_004385 [Streptomyces graminofaciens]
MHSAATPFVLHHWKEGGRREQRSGWRGTSPEFGDIKVTSPLNPSSSESVVAEVRGGSIPTATFESRGIHAEVLTRPTLNRMTLRLGDATVHTSRNRWAPTHRGRALHMRHGGDRYRLWAVNRRRYVLTRLPDSEDPGTRITVARSGRGRRRQITVTVTGRAVAADITLAALFTGVDRSVLTRRGTVRAFISRAFGLFAQTQY